MGSIAARNTRKDGRSLSFADNFYRWKQAVWCAWGTIYNSTYARGEFRTASLRAIRRICDNADSRSGVTISALARLAARLGPGFLPSKHSKPARRALIRDRFLSVNNGARG